MKIMYITFDIFDKKKINNNKKKLVVMGKIESKRFINYGIKVDQLW